MSTLDQQLQAAAEMLVTLRADIPADVERREGLPFTGQTVAAALGEICAQVDAVAHACQILIEAAQEARATTTRRIGS